MFSIINTGLANVLVWFSPGSQAVSTLAPHSTRPASDCETLPAALPLSPWRPHRETSGALQPNASAASHTSACSDMRESSHTQEFTIA
jgi:hypothetical protein